MVAGSPRNKKYSEPSQRIYPQTASVHHKADSKEADSLSHKCGSSFRMFPEAAVGTAQSFIGLFIAHDLLLARVVDDKLKSRRLFSQRLFSYLFYGLVVWVKPITVYRSGHFHDRPENSLCGILHGNHDSRGDTGRSHQSQDAGDCERLSVPCQIRHDSPAAHLYDPGGHPGGHPNGHGPIPAPGRRTDWIDQERSQSLLQEPTRMRTS
jgi:hypothetical protein